MAPGGRRGAKGVKTKSELSLGDLVLAKVKGYPAWPAKISRPEDWERTPDPKKYFVYFFGTEEIAFVAPADIQAFTSDAKNKLLARCQGKTVKYFAQAVREICEAYEELQHKTLSGVRDEKSTRTLASEAHSLDLVVDKALQVDVNDGIDTKRQDEVESQDMKPCSAGDMNHNLSPHISSGKRNKLLNSSTIVKEEGSRDIKVEGRCSDDSPNDLTNGNKLKQAMGSKKKVEGARRNSNNSRSGLDVGSERKEKKLLKERKHSEAANNDRVDTELNFEENNKVHSKKKMKAHQGREKQSLRTNETKISKSVDTGDDASKLKAQTNRKNDSRIPNVHDDKVTNIELKRSSVGKMENRLPHGVQINADESNHFTDEDDLPPTKRHRRALDSMSNSALIPENKLGSSASRQVDLIPANKVRSPVGQLPMKRRAVRLCDDDDDELPKTPIHGGFMNKVSVTPRMLDSKRKPVMHGGSRVDDQLVFRNSGPIDDGLNEKVQSARVPNVASSPAARQGMDKKTRELSSAHVSSSPLQLDSEKLSSMEATPGLVSPKRSTQSITGVRPSAEPQNKHISKAPGIISQKKDPTGANRGIATAFDRSTSFLNQSLSERNKSASSEEKRKTSPKSNSQIDDSVVLVRNQNENISTLGERLDTGKDDKTRFPIDSKIPDSVMSMKHLIAAAQARKKQAHLQIPYGNSFSLLIADSDMHGRSPSQNTATLAFESSNMLQPEVQGLHPTSPTLDLHQISSFNQHENEELEERRVSSGHQATGSSLSGSTEAAVARDAFEGMIETLSRTKESIGRATRLAIDCAKYGITNEVVELLIQKLENEPSLHRRVDLFFLVDSITQCSHSQRGIAGASYIPIVQAALPRLIGAAAPSSAGAQENRRQCRKVLRLWLERKILPESVLRRYMDDIGVVNDDSAAGLSLRRPSRAERSIDDPIREMEGMVVDEYGSNATFQLPGLLSSHVFEEDEEYEGNFETNICKEIVDTSPSKHSPSASQDPENDTVTPSDRRHCILEDVDGELEMEDVSHLKEERPLFNNGTLEPNSNGILESASNISPDSLSSPEGSPPLPPGSPPVTPPLPTSPPPPYFPPPPVGPPPLLSQQSFPTQPPLMSLHIPPLSSTLSTSPRSAYQQLHEIGSTTAPAGNQTTYMVSSTRGSHFDVSVRSEVLKQQSHAGHNSSRPVDYGPSDAYINSQASQHRQQFLPDSAPFAQRPLRPELQPQRPPTHFAYANSVQQHQYPPYSLPNFSDCPRRYANEEQMRMQVNEFNADGPRGGWMAGGRSCAGPLYPHEGYFGPPAERPSVSVVNYQSSAPNTLSAPTPMTVHSVPMMPCRPEMPAVNWRPT